MFLCFELMQHRSYEYPLPIFDNLTHLKLVLDSNSWGDAKWKWVIQVLHNCTKLQNINIDEVFNDYAEDDMNLVFWFCFCFCVF